MTKPAGGISTETKEIECLRAVYYESAKASLFAGVCP